MSRNSKPLIESITEKKKGVWICVRSAYVTVRLATLENAGSYAALPHHNATRWNLPVGVEAGTVAVIENVPVAVVATLISKVHVVEPGVW
jgi:hypothetical protein